MDFDYYYYDIYGPYRLTPEQIRDRRYYGSEPTLTMARRRFQQAWLVFFEEIDYAVRRFCWIARRVLQRVRRMTMGEERLPSYARLYVHCWEPPRPSPFQCALRSLLRRATPLVSRTAVLVTSQVAKWARRLCPPQALEAPDTIA